METSPDKKRILIIDDEQGFTEMVKLNLEATGNYLVRTENRGANALAAALIYKPDLILLDIIMPDTEGPDICNQFRQHIKLEDIPVIFLTATVRKDEVDAHQGKIGGHAFLAKPSSFEELVKCIEAHLKIRS